MNLVNLLKLAYNALLRNKTRALLTMLGIIIGIASVIAMVSLGQSSSVSINSQISDMGTNLIMIMRAPRNQGGGKHRIGQCAKPERKRCICHS